MAHDHIEVRGARVHNLKSIDVSFPRDRLIVVTGLSGSGKSSLAFDTIYAEGQRRYVESLSAYARQFLEQVEKPDVDLIEGLSPAISIEQKTAGSHSRSTVGTVTEIQDYLRLLFANIGVPHCPECDRPITPQSIARICDIVLAGLTDERINVLAPIVRGRKGEFKKELAALRARGFTKVRVDGLVRSLDEDLKLERRRNHDVEVLVDRLVIRSGVERRLRDGIELALGLADDVVIINTLGGGDRLYSRKLACARCGISMPELTSRVFSFNSPQGACRVCQGLGTIDDFDPARIVPDGTKTLNEGAITPWAAGDTKLVREALDGLSRHFGVDLDTPFDRLPPKQRQLLLHGPAPTTKHPIAPAKRATRGSRATEPFGRDFEGILPNLRRRYAAGSWSQQELIEPLRSLQTCSGCQGERLRPESRAVRMKGRTIAELLNLPITEAVEAFGAIELSERETIVAGQVLREIRDRLGFLNDVGVGYLTLARGAATLSGGEGQRIRLATQIGAKLTGVLYVLDEPSIGLHQRDNRLLLSTLAKLRDLGNTVIVVEHDEETIRASDYLVDLGPGAGEHGGEVIFQGTPAELLADGHHSLTGSYLRGTREIPTPSARRPPAQGELVVRGARANNLKNIDVAIPIGLLTAITGVSGSGKSTLINDILYRVLARDFYRAAEPPGAHRCIDGIDLVDKVIQIDQSADRAHATLEPRDLHGAVHFCPRAVRDAARRTSARVSTGPVLVQRQRRPVRSMPGRRGHRDRDAFFAGRLRDLRALHRPAIQPGDARGPLSWRLHRRRPGVDRRPGDAVAREPSADRDQAAYAAGCRVGLCRARAIGDHAVGWRGSTCETVQRVVTPEYGSHRLHPGRAHDRLTLRGHEEIDRCAATAGRPGQHRCRDRAPP